MGVRHWALVAGLVVGCSDVTGLGGLDPDLIAPAVVDFGDVQLGVSNTREIMISNTGQVLLAIDVKTSATFTSDLHAYDVMPTRLTLAPGQSAPLSIGFRAFSATPEPISTTITLSTDGQEEDGTLLSIPVTLRGRGVRDVLRIEPNPADFGTVLVGSSRELDITITNLLATPVALNTLFDGGGRPVITTEAGHGMFQIDVASLPTLEGGASTTVTARYSPDPGFLGTEDRASWVVRSCPDALCDAKVTLIGKGGDAALSCAPAAVDFGGVNPGRSATRTVRCTNVATDPVEILGWSLDPNSAPEFGVMPSDIGELPPGTNIDIAVTLTPGALGGTYAGQLIVRGRNVVTTDGFAPSRIGLAGTSGGPRITVLPDRLFFGPVEVGTIDRRSVVVLNEGFADLLVSTTQSGPPFGARNRQIILRTGTATVVEVSFAPTLVGAATGALTLNSNDATTPSLDVPLSGDGVMVGPCTATIAPSVISYGLVAVRDRASAPVDIINTGTGTCLINHIAAHALMGTSTLAFSLLAGPTSVMLGPGMTHSVTVEYRPQSAGPDMGALDMYISDPAASLPRVALIGTGYSTTRVDCPADITIDAGSQVSLEVNAVSQTGTITSYKWEVNSAPPAGIGTPNQWTPDPPDQRVELFRPYLVGRYGLRVTVEDTDGLTATCTTAVTAISHGLRVELTWDGFGDVDLHLHNANRTPWFGRGMTIGAEDDCFYANCSMSAVPAGPLWDPMSLPYEQRNPALDVDNIVAVGPENIRVDETSTGDNFTVALHYFWDHGYGGRVATTNIYCGRVTQPVAIFTSTTMIGLDMGGCTQNTFWKVASVTFTSSGTCTVLPLDIYQTGADACASF